MSKTYTTQEAASLLGCTYDTLRKRLSLHPELQPAKKFGRSWQWTADEIEAAQKVTS
ncbi:helix-turn-helix domain-containing protein [Kocuria rosea]|uniref:helix-turn-helix domain-containing protein n=1 Tax=Kocuria rosea TaxID=1275 RepID=UPI003D6CC4F9